jgi:hypothetical protein
MGFIRSSGSRTLAFICASADLGWRPALPDAGTQGPLTGRSLVFDVVFLALGVAFVAAAVMYTMACDRL